MAILCSKNLILEYKIEKINSLYIISKLQFFYKNKTIFNLELCKYENCFSVIEDIDDDFILFIENVLFQNRADCFECVDGDTQIAIYPNEFFPFIHKEQNINLDKNLDFFTIVAFVSSYHFDSNYRSTDGISMHLSVSREELNKFLNELKDEKNRISK